MPTTVGSISREHVETFIADQLSRWAPTTAATRYRCLQQYSAPISPRASAPPVMGVTTLIVGIAGAGKTTAPGCGARGVRGGGLRGHRHLDVGPGGADPETPGRHQLLPHAGVALLAAGPRPAGTEQPPKAGALVVRMDDGGDLRRLKAEEIAVDRLAHAYAVTVHRSQGSTVHGPTPWRTAAGGELA